MKALRAVAGSCAAAGSALVRYTETQYGFDWGGAEISRCFSDHKSGWVVLQLVTAKHPHGIQIYVTKSGKVRIHDHRGEWTPPNATGSATEGRP